MDHQVGIRCHKCEVPVPNLQCDFCHVHLCKTSVREHLCDESKEYKIVPFKQRGSTIRCSLNPTKICELHCEQYSIPICIICVSSGKHEQHTKTEIFSTFEIKKEQLKKDIPDLENSIYRTYQKTVTNIPVQKNALRKNSEMFSKDLNNQGEICKRSTRSHADSSI